MTLETLSQKTYTPLTFFKNARKIAPRVAWDLDKAYTADRHPTLARINNCGVECVKDFIRRDNQIIPQEKTFFGNFVRSLTYGPVICCHLPLGYLTGVISGLFFGSKPEDFQYDSRKLQISEETQ